MVRNIHVTLYEYGMDEKAKDIESTILQYPEETVSHNLGLLGALKETSVTVRRNKGGGFYWRATEELDVYREEQQDSEREGLDSDDYLVIRNHETHMAVRVMMKYEKV